MTYRWTPIARWPAVQAEARTAVGAGVLDAEALARLAELDPGGKAGLVARVLGTYSLSLRRLLDQLRVAGHSADAAAMRSAAHTLKSSSASVGALTLARQCAELEALARDCGSQTDGLAAPLDALLTEGQRILDGLSS